MYNKYLPIGTVVMLKNGKKRIMITGFCSRNGNDLNKVYDYNGCLYPEGLYDSKQVLLFDHKQIEKIYHMGLVDKEEQEFKVKLEKMIEEKSS